MTGTPPEPLSKIPRDRDDDFATDIVERRVRLAERAAGQALPHLRGRTVDPHDARGNVENFIGFAQVPVGLAGPLRIHGSAGSREVYVPMATTEGAIVASYSRGMSVINNAGGAWTRVLGEGLSQHPILVYDSAADALASADRATALGAEFQDLTAGITNHGRLVSVRPQVIGRRLILCLRFTTGDAIGINMAAHAAELCAAHLAQKTAARARYVHGQDVEKRANARAQVEGRGRTAVAEVTIGRADLERRMRCTPEALVAILDSYRVGFAQLGTQNYTVQTANGLTAIMIACGQDPAYVTECATGQLDFAVTDSGDLHASIFLPSLLVGTVGGGSNQGTAAECLQIMGVRGSGRANTFAEIIAASMLAGDLSLMAAFCSHEFVAAHEHLGRNRPDSADVRTELHRSEN